MFWIRSIKRARKLAALKKERARRAYIHELNAPLVKLSQRLRAASSYEEKLAIIDAKMKAYLGEFYE